MCSPVLLATHLYSYFHISPKQAQLQGFWRVLDLGGRARICARELASVASRCLQGGSYGLPLTTGRTTDVVPMFRIRHWDRISNVKVFLAQNQVFGHAQTFPFGYLNHLEMSHRLRGSRTKKEQLEKQTCLESQPMILMFYFEIILDGPLHKANKGYLMHNSEFRSHLNCAQIALLPFFNIWGTKYILVIIFLFSYASIYIYIV